MRQRQWWYQEWWEPWTISASSQSVLLATWNSQRKFSAATSSLSSSSISIADLLSPESSRKQCENCNRLQDREQRTRLRILEFLELIPTSASRRLRLWKNDKAKNKTYTTRLGFRGGAPTLSNPCCCFFCCVEEGRFWGAVCRFMTDPPWVPWLFIL